MSMNLYFCIRFACLSKRVQKYNFIFNFQMFLKIFLKSFLNFQKKEEKHLSVWDGKDNNLLPYNPNKF